MRGIINSRRNPGSYDCHVRYRFPHNFARHVRRLSPPLSEHVSVSGIDACGWLGYSLVNFSFAVCDLSQEQNFTLLPEARVFSGSDRRKHWGYYMAWHAFGGFISTLGLSILATLWWSFTLLAVIYARVGNIAAHRQWMLRSFALTYAAVTLRLMALALSLYPDEVTQSQVVYWLSWILNLALVQMWIRKL
ncbi:MAG: DUF2306 domain-containing protein [Gammaproteobacteria bacterium]|nr:DUF2306 domain-containing protein [Gammaproteobacteria bacterium]